MKMKTKTKPSFDEEKKYWTRGIDYIIGIDEVGRGAFAGPIVAAGVIYKPNFKHLFLKDVNDSKMLSHKRRNELSPLIKKHALFFAIEEIGVPYINKYGIGKANNAVFRKVLKKLIPKIGSSNFFILADGFHKKYLPGGILKQKGILKGDRTSISIASASIIAKVRRDNIMKDAEFQYPNYKFAKNKGYGTLYHRRMIQEHGLTIIHRTSFHFRSF